MASWPADLEPHALISTEGLSSTSALHSESSRVLLQLGAVHAVAVVGTAYVPAPQLRVKIPIDIEFDPTALTRTFRTHPAFDRLKSVFQNLAKSLVGQ